MTSFNHIRIENCSQCHARHGESRKASFMEPQRAWLREVVMCVCVCPSGLCCARSWSPPAPAPLSDKPGLPFQYIPVLFLKAVSSPTVKQGQGSPPQVAGRGCTGKAATRDVGTTRLSAHCSALRVLTLQPSQGRPLLIRDRLIFLKDVSFSVLRDSCQSFFPHCVKSSLISVFLCERAGLFSPCGLSPHFLV